jgi:hypothetical protein
VLLLYGLAMIPLQYVLLDMGKWILMPQFQPARAVLFITALAGLLGTAAAWQAASRGRWRECAAWFLLVFAIPVNGLVAQLFTTGDWRRLGTVALLALLASLACWRPILALPVALSAFFIVPYVGGVQASPQLHSAELDELAAWARASTDKDQVFFFADVGHGLAPGIFRAGSLRALYVDWKSGGQANLLKDYGFEWWKRWHAVNQAELPLRPLGEYRSLGIDYLVVKSANSPPGVAPAFRNAQWAVLPLSPGLPGTAPPPPAAGSTPARPGV